MGKRRPGMDDRTVRVARIDATIRHMERREGFNNQRLCVVPRPLIDEALTVPVTRRLVVTDAGYFPRAQNHGRHRPEGIAETIVIVCIAGSGWVETNGTRSRIGPGGAVVIPGDTAHAYGATEKDPWTIWWCHIRGTDAPELVEAAGIGDGQLVLSLRGVDRIVAMFDEIVSALERDQSPMRLVATAGMAWRLLTQMAVDRSLPEQGEPLERAMRYLSERVDGTIKVPELAALVGVSPSHLSSLFRRATGGGVLAHHSALKMARARHLLDTTDLSIAEVSREIGMADQFYFSRQFSRLHNISPSGYRAHHKG
jgi:AraC family transcriptional regulator of arabinose operon